MIKNPPAMWETWVQSLGWEDPLEEGMATHSSILAWRISWTEDPGWATVHGVAKSQGHDCLQQPRHGSNLNVHPQRNG